MGKVGIESFLEEGPLEAGDRGPSACMLIDQLKANDELLASFAEVARCAASRLLGGAGVNDYSHSEGVHARLSELLPNAVRKGMSSYEVLILVLAAYLHDLGKTASQEADAGHGTKKSHGSKSADDIRGGKCLALLFPCCEVQECVARVVAVHDEAADSLNELDEKYFLDIRPNVVLGAGREVVRLRMLGALLKMADELECNSDRTRWSLGDDPRNLITGIDIDPTERTIRLKMKGSAKDATVKKCRKHIEDMLKELAPILERNALDFRLLSEHRTAVYTEEKTDDRVSDAGDPLRTRDLMAILDSERTECLEQLLSTLYEGEYT